jgi:alkyl sulfatase BDS1-like metallo-beta-lactamase superfamily hydrolase
LQSLRRGAAARGYTAWAILILDDATIADMKEKRARDKAADAAAREKQAISEGATDWKAAMKEWEDWEKSRQS